MTCWLLYVFSFKLVCITVWDEKLYNFESAYRAYLKGGLCVLTKASKINDYEAKSIYTLTLVDFTFQHGENIVHNTIPKSTDVSSTEISILHTYLKLDLEAKIQFLWVVKESSIFMKRINNNVKSSLDSTSVALSTQNCYSTLLVYL